ncbi:CLK4-associating serine/arginine rich protein [Camelus ferus]|nr:CLK4-associating serine/arginine rich protein [Camelus ferus]
MWHEARKHERKLRGMMVDYKKRAERRREYYEKIKKDPAQFLQVHGRACKVHLDSAVALAAESPVNMMPWQGDTNNMIDRFDVRAHLDHIPDYTPPLLTTISPEQESDERKCNYERYRGLVQNDFAGISEEQCLYQIYIDELYGGLQRPSEDEKKKLAEKKASIGYTYEDSTVAEVEKVAEKPEEEESPAEEESNSDEDEVIPDIDVEVDVDELNQEQVADLNKQATTYGMADGDFVRMLRKDKEEAEAIKHAKALEEEKAMYSGRRSRRQRREFREKRLRGRKISPPSYARRDSPTYDPYKRAGLGLHGVKGSSCPFFLPGLNRLLVKRQELPKSPKLTPQEKLKLRMQKALNRQFKADKKAAQEKMIQQEHERQEREDELRAMARKIRMKERERREKEREEWERQYSRQSRSPSPRYSREYSSSRRAGLIPGEHPSAADSPITEAPAASRHAAVRSRSRSRSPHYRH